MVAYKKKVPQASYITPQEYLERERKAETKSEYYGGVIVAMAGASKAHNRITFNLVRHLGNQMDSGDCEGFSSDMRVRIPQCNRYYYPDLAVVCGESSFEDAELDTLLNPTVIIEVLSPTTEKADREEKFDCYRTLDSLKIYVLVAQDSPRVETYTRQPDGLWGMEVTKGMDAVVGLNVIGCALKMADIYDRIAFPEEAETPANSSEGEQH